MEAEWLKGLGLRDLGEERCRGDRRGGSRCVPSSSKRLNASLSEIWRRSILSHSNRELRNGHSQVAVGKAVS